MDSASSCTCPGAIHTPADTEPKPSRVSWVRRVCRLARSDSGTEKTTSTQPSSTVARRAAKMRGSPSRSIRSVSGEIRYPAAPDTVRASSSPARFSRETQERTVGASTPRSASSWISEATDIQPSVSRAYSP